MPGRKYEAQSGYRYGFNGQEKSSEISNNSTTAEFWQFDARIGRRWNVDPVIKDYESPYATFGNNPIWFADPDGCDTSKYISSKQTVDAIKISYDLIKKRLDDKKYSIGGDYTKEIQNSIDEYWNKNKDSWSIEAYDEFRDQAFEYEKGLREVVNGVKGESIFRDYGAKILYNKNVSNDITVQATQKLINTKNGELVKIMEAGLQALAIASGSVGARVGSGPRGNVRTNPQVILSGNTTPKLSPFKLEMTHSLTLSKAEFTKLKANIQVHGIKESVKYVESNGIKYIVDGHHRVRIAKELGIDLIPVERVKLPYGQYKNTNDLIYSQY